MTVISPFLNTILIFGGINAILAFSLYLPLSCGQLSLAQGGFMAIGAYSSAVLTKNFGVPFGLALLGGGSVACVFGYLVGFPALRIKGIYLLLMTLGFNEIIRVFFLNFSYTGGVGGFGGIKPMTNLYNLYPVLFLLLVFYYRFHNSHLGRAMRAINQDQDAAEARGLPLTRLKTFAFGGGAFIAGLAGGYYAHFVQFIESENFGFMTSLDAMVYVLLGGSQIFWGPLLGAYLVTTLPEIFRVFQKFRYEIFGASLVLMMILRPRGLLDEEVCSVAWWKELILRRRAQ
ncbi:MAG: branched-chain amino acid ABC transporter permease [Desulfomonile tiedjei]|uniref:Branched-chain amino acid ABC transporter permease n=1 Tax=Desulfomonile tiedjei TaxID=2358 RepID=A0A9D6Z5S2_9BACT|nr:branched-chain amino acid ABC transporter permease [Desulfomonile tiedjei]